MSTNSRHPTENSTALTIGGEVKVVGLAVSGKLFVFSPVQMQFLLSLQRLKEPTAAALAVGKDEAWGQGFLRSRKFRQYLHCKMDEFSVKNGLTVEWWHQFGKWAAEGYKESYQIACAFCTYSGVMSTYEAESFRSDEMQLEIPCPACFKPVHFEHTKEPFLPNREQMEAWKALGDRLIPKVERVHHQFENVNISFESEEAS